MTDDKRKVEAKTLKTLDIRRYEKRTRNLRQKIFLRRPQKLCRKSRKEKINVNKPSWLKNWKYFGVIYSVIRNHIISRWTGNINETYKNNEPQMYEDITLDCFRFIWFYGLSTIVSYLMPNLVHTYIRYIWLVNIRHQI